ncbi:MAG TPA: PfkB family carbohydrate kinase, partial [Bauldia sp.]|nr:PfkB family carbohydrate kinase [Bauldia sp.]
HPRLEIMAVTDGDRGAVVHTRDGSVSVEAFPVAVVDTVGCGDAFMASLLVGILETNMGGIDRMAIERIARRASAAGAVIATRAGGMMHMPRPEEIDAMIATKVTEAT